MTTRSELLLLVVASTTACGDGLFTAPALASDPAACCAMGGADVPVCNGLPATIWVRWTPHGCRTAPPSWSGSTRTRRRRRLGP